MKTKLILLFLILPAMAWAQNVKVVNPDSSPAAVKVISGGLVNSADPHVVAAPGSTPSPSPAQAVVVQGISGGTAVAVKPVQGAPTDRSGTITTGGSSQTLAAALSTRTYIEVQNISDETMYVNFGAAATTDSNSFKIAAGGSYVNPAHFCPTGTITIIGATTGKKFVAKEG